MNTNTAETFTNPLDVHYLRGVRGKVHNELSLMAKHLGMQVTDEPFAAIYRTAAEHLFAIEQLCCDGDIDPRAWLRMSEDDEFCLPYPRALRVGFYPIAANPLHWGHVLIGLRAMASLGLDKIVYLISGRDNRKPDLTPADLRYIMAWDTLKLFGPLFASSSLARDRGFDGETNLFRFLKLNRRQPLEVFYIAGGDHCRRFYPGTDYPDTIIKLELHQDVRIFSHDPAQHRINAVFIDRAEHGSQAETTLPVHFLEALPFAASSTMIRAALDGSGPAADLALLPYSASADIRTMKLYCHRPAASPRQPRRHGHGYGLLKTRSVATPEQRKPRTTLFPAFAHL